jgi:hypothetical protein
VAAFSTPGRSSANRKIRTSVENKMRVGGGSGAYHRPTKGSKKTSLAKTRTRADLSSRTKTRTAYKNKSYNNRARR